MKALALSITVAFLALAIICAANGCTGEQLANSGKRHLVVKMDPNSTFIGYDADTDLTAGHIMVKGPAGIIFEANNLNSNGSTGAAIRGDASKYQLTEWTASFKEFMTTVREMAPLFNGGGGGSGMDAATLEALTAALKSINTRLDKIEATTQPAK